MDQINLVGEFLNIPKTNSKDIGACLILIFPAISSYTEHLQISKPMNTLPWGILLSKLSNLSTEYVVKVTAVGGYISQSSPPHYTNTYIDKQGARLRDKLIPVQKNTI